MKPRRFSAYMTLAVLAGLALTWGYLGVLVLTDMPLDRPRHQGALTVSTLLLLVCALALAKTARQAKKKGHGLLDELAFIHERSQSRHRSNPAPEWSPGKAGVAACLVIGGTLCWFLLPEHGVVFHFGHHVIFAPVLPMLGVGGLGYLIRARSNRPQRGAPPAE